jgi:2-polyprenyl-3-methyl-5-hydroxy-6-metoxy-1,4-benzoquinol methylase
MRVKIKLEDYYQPFHQIIPKQATVLDLGCGYGFLGYMLHFLEPDRVITGVDYDDEKIAVANNGYWKGDNLNFIYADVTKHLIANHDVIIVSDVLHYLEQPQQEDLLNRSVSALNPGGLLIVRDGDLDLKKHSVTVLSELFSIKLLRFNKSVNTLNFVSGEKLKQWAKNSNLEIEVIKSQKHTSNVIFAIRKANGISINS